MADAVIFDFDGVLVDSERVHMRSILGAIRERGWDADEGQLFDEFVGTSDRFCFETIAVRHGEALDEAAVSALIARKLEHFLGAVERGEVCPYPGAVELVRAASERVPVVVCSGSRRATVLPVLERIGVLGVIKGLVGADDVVKTKPDPEPYRKAAGVLGVAPESCVSIEDTHHGIAAGKGAGVRVLGVRHTCSDDRLAHADEVFDSIGEISVETLLG